MSTTPPKSATVTFTIDEARATLELIDIAVKAVGMKAAKAGVVISEKINAAFEPPKEIDVLQQLPSNGN